MFCVVFNVTRKRSFPNKSLVSNNKSVLNKGFFSQADKLVSRHSYWKCVLIFLLLALTVDFEF